ncbi:hypothetical protein FOMPIDRAFT_1025847 [Fomitopsis schrenkii]|uniref:Uncharacterized protein n=1 Tax=Fomitopsis schrenkii TaxID=2126942 RepID=S8F0F9_FOMSC|nr:hypothetical protein FOMPIDRAFT_1025847 [Fomitopsis schrenkii]
MLGECTILAISVTQVCLVDRGPAYATGRRYARHLCDPVFSVDWGSSCGISDAALAAALRIVLFPLRGLVF